jgi:phenylacetate-CoA ligase
MPDSRYFIPDEETLEPPALAAMQRRKLAALLEQVRATNPFYRDKLTGVSFDPLTDPLDRLPFTTRAELEADQVARPPFGTNLTFPLDRYCRFHQTSGTGGRAMRWLDTRESWQWFARCWGVIFTAAGAQRGDRVLFPFSFGPFVGFWAAFGSAVEMGMLAIPAGGLSTTARLRMALENEVTLICCTPTYALHMAEVAGREGIDLAGRSRVRAIIVAGEPGGSIPATRQRIEAAWGGARVIDHTGMTEIGAMSFECGPRRGEGVHVIESEFIPEVIDPETGETLPPGESGELVLTNLGRIGSPLIRYRTGDHVRLTRGNRCTCGRWFARLEGGILGRTDDMFIVRGNNVFPPAVEAVVRRFPEVAEFRAIVRRDGALTQVALEIEPAAGNGAATGAAGVQNLLERIGGAVQEALHFRCDVAAVPPGTLPRFEMKAKRFVRLNGDGAGQ